LFSLGGLLAGLAPRKLLRIHLFSVKPERTPVLLRSILIIVLLCGVLAWAKTSQNVDIDQSFEPDYFGFLSIYASLLFATEKKDWQFWVMTAIAFIGCIFGTGRTGLLTLISGLSAIHLLQTKRESLLVAIRFLSWPIALFAALFIGLIFTKEAVRGMTGDVIGIAKYGILSYILGPLAAFDKVVQNPADFMMATNHTFQSPLHWAARLHLTDYTPPPLLDSFVFVPFAANVYTVFKFYFLELSIVGTVLLMLFFGLFHSLLYLKAKQGGRFSTYLFAYSMFPVLMVIFDDHYNKIGIYLYVAAFGLLYLLIGSVPLRLFPAIKVRRRSN
jgi:oligosaccharide repeat unit polymerase